MPVPPQLRDGDRRISQVPGEPQCAHAPLSDPGGIGVFGPFNTSMLPSVWSDDVGSHKVTLSRLHHAACTLPVYASRPRLPASTQHLGSGCGPALPGGIGYPLGSTERFPPSCRHYMTFSFPRLCLAHRPYVPVPPRRRPLSDDSYYVPEAILHSPTRCPAPPPPPPEKRKIVSASLPFSARQFVSQKRGGAHAGRVPETNDLERHRLGTVHHEVGTDGEDSEFRNA